MEKKKCTRCGRTDLPILSNGLCTRCDNELYGYKPTTKDTSSYPYGWRGFRWSWGAT